jgi:hypothetical protein
MSRADLFCPYVGLQPYTREQRAYFFGRDRDLRVISSNLYAARLTVLHGASGVGKSSVLLAGVVPHLEASRRTAVVVFREWQRPDFLAQLARATAELVPAPRREAEIPANVPFDELLLRVSRALGGTVVVLFDQFEEYFTYHPESEAGNTFDGELARAINREDVDASFLFSLREDGLSRLHRFRARIPNLLGNMLRLEHLDLRSAEEAIRGPLEVYNRRVAGPGEAVTIEDALVHQVLDEVRAGQVVLGGATGLGQAAVQGDARIETPFLQLVLTRLWEEERLSGSRCLRLETLTRLGGAAQIIRTHLDRVMTGLSPLHQRLCARFFDRLVTPSGSKIACRIDDLSNWAGDLAAEVQGVVTSLSEGRILRAIPAPAGQPGAAQYEIFHDVLAPAILDWRLRHEQERAREALATQSAEEAAKRERELDRQRDLDRAQAKAKAKARAARNLRVVIAALSAALLIAGASTWRAVQSAKKASEARLDANADRFLAKEAEKEAQTLRISAEQERASAVEQRRIAEARLARIQKSVEIKQALVNREVSPGEVTKMGISINRSLVFLTLYDPRGPADFRFWVLPEAASMARSPEKVVMITYRMEHETFRNRVMVAGPEDGFTAWYEGYGCLRKVTAVIEFENPQVLPEVAFIDMCALQQQKR